MSRERAITFPASNLVSFSCGGVYAGLVRIGRALALIGIPLALYGLVQAMDVSNPWPFRFFLAVLFVFLTAAVALHAAVTRKPVSH